MKKSLLVLFLFVGCISSKAHTYYGFDFLTLDESAPYKFVKAMDAESRKAIEDMLGGNKETEDKGIIRRDDGEWYVRKDYPLPEGDFYESNVYLRDNGQINYILPKITVNMGEAQLNAVMEYIGDKVTVKSGDNDYVNYYYLKCNVKTSEEVLDICLFLYDCAYDYGILGVKVMDTERYRIDSYSYLGRILTGTNQPFVPKNDGEVLIYEKDFVGIEEYTWWDYMESDPNLIELTDEGLAITNPTKNEQIWQPQMFFGTEDYGFGLEANHDYIVRLTLKVPSDGTYQVVLGSWSCTFLCQLPVIANDDFQEIDFEFPFLGNGAEQIFDLESCHAILQVGWVVGTTIINKIQVIEQTKGGLSGMKLAKFTKVDGALYNLAGQKVDSSYKGLVIQNGRKYIQR